MFKRVFWLGTGVAVGASGAFWAKRKAEEAIEQYLPDQVAERAATSARDLGRTVRSAAAEGREAMRSTEAELRARVEARTFVGPERATVEPKAPAPSGRRRTSRSPANVTSSAPARRRARR